MPKNPKPAAVPADVTAGEKRRRPTGKPFVKGKSGNPSGRPPGRRNVASALASIILEEEAESLIRSAIKSAKDGNESMLRFLLERLVPLARDRAVRLPAMPRLSNLKGVNRAARVILEAVANGDLVPSEAGELAQVLEITRRGLEVTDLEEQFSRLASEVARLLEAHGER